MDVRVYDFDFNLLAIMSDIISSAWSIKYNGVGSYEGHFRLCDEISDIFLKNRYLIVAEGDNQAVCTGKVAGSELLICGRTVNWLLEKRVMPPFKTRLIFGEEYVSPYEIGNMVLERTFAAPPQIDESGAYISDSIDDVRIVPNFNLPPESDCAPLNRHFWRNSANTVEDIMADLAEMMGTGHRLVFNIDEKSWDFEYISGCERDIAVSEENRNFYDMTYTEDMLDEASGGWYAVYSAEDDFENAEAAEDDTGWKYIKKETALSGIKYWETALEASGESEAESEMRKKRVSKTVQGCFSKLKYKTDYDLGDTVRVTINYGNFREELKYKITGVNLWINSRRSGEEPIFTETEEE